MKTKSSKNSEEKPAAAKKPQSVVQGPVKDPTGKTVKVKSKVNMMCMDGTRLIVGKQCVIGLAEHDRLLKDKRGPFWEK